MKEENQKKIENIMNKAPPPYIIALGHALLSKKNVRELLWLHARLQKYNVIIKIIIYHDAVR